ncbi:glycoside hydrolase family 5 protein [Prevotella sp. 10(H)]|uniref:glycoside hydrolase family 5 protein n=1 Tax=Prevotella sp. 10(H) TaxID=1158294 RepID=UPI0004A71F3D|nr:glycoside hydrolase family 5 protein [Prevotella sp. 10(H)]
MKKLILFLIFTINALYSCGSDDDKRTPPPPEGGGDRGGTSTEYKGIKEHFGVNLSGAEFAQVYPGIDGTNYGYPTAQCLDYFKKKNLMLIRFPFRWERVQHVLNGDLYTPDINKMKTFVKAAEDRDMLIILDMHNFARRSLDGGATLTIIGTTPSLTVAHLADVWMKLAMEFKDYKNIWAYDIMNEPYDMPSTLSWYEMAQTVIYKIRAVDTETPIIISGDSFSSASRWAQVSDNLKNLKDPSNKLIYQAHTYFDEDASGQYQNSYDANHVTPQTGVERVKPFVEWLKKNKKVGILGEYGIPDNDDRWKVVLENMLAYLRDNGVPGTYWSAGPRWGDYSLAVQPTNNYTKDRPQMSVLEKYTKTKQVE